MQALNDNEEVIYRFEGFELDPTRRLLLKEGRAVQLTPKAFDTLLVLVRQRGRVIEKDELMQAVWPGFAGRTGRRRRAGLAVARTFAAHSFRRCAAVQTTGRRRARRHSGDGHRRYVDYT